MSREKLFFTPNNSGCNNKVKLLFESYVERSGISSPIFLSTLKQELINLCSSGILSKIWLWYPMFGKVQREVGVDLMNPSDEFRMKFIGNVKVDNGIYTTVDDAYVDTNFDFLKEYMSRLSKPHGGNGLFSTVATLEDVGKREDMFESVFGRNRSGYNNVGLLLNNYSKQLIYYGGASNGTKGQIRPHYDNFSGVFIFNKKAKELSCFKNGTKSDALERGDGNIPGGNFWLLRQNGSYYKNTRRKIKNFLICGRPLTDEEAVILNNSINNQIENKQL